MIDRVTRPFSRARMRSIKFLSTGPWKLRGISHSKISYFAKDKKGTFMKSICDEQGRGFCFDPKFFRTKKQQHTRNRSGGLQAA